MVLRSVLVIFLFVSMNIFAGIHVTSPVVGYPEDILLKVDLSTSYAGIHVVLPNGKSDYIHLKQSSIVRYSPKLLGNYTFEYGDHNIDVQVVNKPNIQLDTPLTYSTNQKLAFHLSGPDLPNVEAEFEVILEGNSVHKSNGTEFEFIAVQSGKYDVIARVNFETKLIKTNPHNELVIRRTFVATDLRNNWYINVPKFVWQEDLPLDIRVFTPLHSFLKTTWKINGNSTVGNELTWSTKFRHLS